MQNIIIVGAGGFGREVYQYMRDAFLTRSGYTFKGFLDDAFPQLKDLGLDGKVIGTTTGYRIEDSDRFLVAVGDPKIRRMLTERIAQRGGKFLTLIHPTAYVATTAEIGEGSILTPFTLVGPNAVLGVHILMNNYSSIGHDAQIGDHTIFCPYATVNGYAIVSSGVFLGSHSTITARKQIGRDSKIAAGSVVYEDVPDRALAVGNPATARIVYPE
jgi:sugar O-acyltransferase (sialic acid O-acetyltransferase NeuD family)